MYFAILFGDEADQSGPAGRRHILDSCWLWRRERNERLLAAWTPLPPSSASKLNGNALPSDPILATTLRKRPMLQDERNFCSADSTNPIKLSLSL